VSVTTSRPCGIAPGSVQLYIGSNGYQTVPLANGSATIPIPETTQLTMFPGSWGIHVVYAESGPVPFYAPTISPTVTTTITQASTTTTLSPATSGTSLTAAVSVAPPGSGSPTGTVQFANGGSPIGSPVQLANGQATIPITAGVVGNFTASYSGNSNYLGSSGALRLGPQPTSVVTLTSSLNPSNIGQSVTFTASLAVTNGNGPPSGTIQFSDGSTLLGKPVPVSGGQATYTTSSLAIGSHVISASYSGDTQYPAASSEFGQVVNRVPTVLTLSSSPSSPAAGQAVTLTAQLGPQPPAGLPGPTGQVTFSEGTTVLGVAPVSSAAAVLKLAALAAGQNQIAAVYSGDANWSTIRTTITVTVGGGPLTIVTTSLPEAAVGVAYTAPAMSASGGAPPLQWSISQTTPSASGILLASNGTFSGTPTTAGTYTLTVQVTDAETTPVSVTKQFTLQVLGITTPSLPGGTTGAPYSTTVTAAGGTAPYTFSVLPSSFTIAPTNDPATATISGNSSVIGPVTLTVSVKDSAGTTASTTYTVNFTPPAPLLIISGVGATGDAHTQPTLNVSIATGYPEDITGTLTLTFKGALNGEDNPEVQFSTGGRTFPFTIPGFSTAPIPGVQFQTGTVAGTITITADMKAGGVDVTPSPGPSQQIQVGAAPPTILSATAATTATGFTVTLTGFSTTVDMSQAVFQFNAASGANLQTTSLTIPLTTLFSSFYQTAVPGPTGSQFVYTQPFTVNGSAGITSVAVTMTNSSGASPAATATIP
jgi:large repetitive protein